MERTGLLNKVKIKMDEYTPEGVSLPFGDIIGPLLDESAIEILKNGPLHLIEPTSLIFRTTKRSIATGVATITLSQAHNFIVGDIITISGITGPGVPTVYIGDHTLTAAGTYTVSFTVLWADEGETADTNGTVSPKITYENDKAYLRVPTKYIRLYEMHFPLWKKSVRKAISQEDPDYKIQENEYTTGGYGRPFVAIVNTEIESVLAKYFECGKVVDPTPSVITPVALYVASAKAEQLNDRFSDAMSWLCASKVFSSLGYTDQAKNTFEQYGIAMQTLVTP